MNKNRYLFSVENLSVLDLSKIEDHRVADCLQDAHSFISDDLNIDIEEISQIEPYLITSDNGAFAVTFENGVMQPVADIYGFINGYTE